MYHLSWILLWTTLFGVACDSSTSRVLPFGPTASPTAAPAPPTNPFPPPGLATSIEIGRIVTGRVADPPECLGFAGWPCVYFRLDAPANGMLTVELKYQRSQNRGQSVDMTIASIAREIWAQEHDQDSTRVRAAVTAGTEYLITLWYTFPDFEFELHTSLVPD